MASEDQRFIKRIWVTGVVGPALGTLFLFTILVGLGAWQMKRLQWKNQLLAAIDQEERQVAVPLICPPRPFEKVTVSGRWLSSVAHYGVEVRDTPQGSRMGSQLVAPLSRLDAPAVLVLLGWVMDGISVALPPGEIHVVGYVRPPEHRGWLSAGDSAGNARFFTLDPSEIGKALAIDVEPFTVVALQDDGVRRQTSDLQPAMALQLPRPINNHLSYALTWFGLAATLLVVFGIWVRRHLLEQQAVLDGLPDRRVRAEIS